MRDELLRVTGQRVGPASPGVVLAWLRLRSRSLVPSVLANLGALGFTGWLYTADMFWGYGWLADLHQALAWALLAPARRASRALR